MECKYIYAHDVGCKNLELIDTLWNVNCIPPLCILKTLLELIDTLWNVNFLMYGIAFTKYSELIDTLWNVNF